MLSSLRLHKNKEVIAINGGENFGKGMCFRIHINGSKRRSWTWHPLFIIWSWFGKSICLSFDLLQGHFLCRLWVNSAKSLVVSFTCSREVHLKPILSRPSTIIHSLRVGLPYVQSNLQNALLLILCHWWGIHQGPPMKIFVPSTSAHYLGSRLRNYLVPWSLHASMSSFLAFNSGFTSLTPDRKIQSDVQYQLIYSHSMDCTMVPWESLTSMVISLALVNGCINDRYSSGFCHVRLQHM